MYLWSVPSCRWAGFFPILPLCVCPSHVQEGTDDSITCVDLPSYKALKR